MIRVVAAVLIQSGCFAGQDEFKEFLHHEIHGLTNCGQSLLKIYRNHDGPRPGELILEDTHAISPSDEVSRRLRHVEHEITRPERAALIDAFASANLSFPLSAVAARFLLIARYLRQPIPLDIVRLEANKYELERVTRVTNQSATGFAVHNPHDAFAILNFQFRTLADDVEALEQLSTGRADEPTERRRLADQLDAYFESPNYVEQASRLRGDLAALQQRRSRRARRTWRTSAGHDAQVIVASYNSKFYRGLMESLKKESGVHADLISFVEDTFRH